MNVVSTVIINFFVLSSSCGLASMEIPSQGVELSQGFGGNLVDELLRDLQKKTEQLSLLELSDKDVKKNVEDSPLKNFFAFGLLDACIQQAATSAAMSSFVYALPYGASRFVAHDAPICLYQGEDFIELYCVDSMKSTGKLSFTPDYAVLFSPQRETFCIWNSERSLIFNTRDCFTHSYLESPKNEKIDPNDLCMIAALPDHPIVEVRYISETLVGMHHVRKEGSHVRVLEHPLASAVDGHYSARICCGNRIEIVSSLYKRGSIQREISIPYRVVDIIWPSYDKGILLCVRDSQCIVAATTRVAYLLSRYKKITAAYSSSSFSTNTNS